MDEIDKASNEADMDAVLRVNEIVARAFVYYRNDYVFREDIGIPIGRPLSTVRWLAQVVKYEARKMGLDK